MALKREDTIVTNLTWQFPLFTGFRVVITNGKLTSLVMPESANEDTIGLVTTNEDYIRALHKSLGDVINELEHQKDTRTKKEFLANKTNTNESQG